MKTGKPNLLIAEDKEYIAGIIEANLSGTFDCKIASDCATALKMAEASDIAIVSLEIEVDKGLALMQSIKATKPIPVLAMDNTGYSTARIRALKGGADDVMSKPFNPEELLYRVLRLVK